MRESGAVVESPRRNEGEGRRAPAEVGSRGASVAPGSPGRTTGPSRPPPPRGAGEVERERPC